ncbi:hypothetical protein MGA3_03990 [Bacillus methanolicus MGA3]|nr:hypothetical protein MGA3_03990 [Bacillus methanolicus MGA3]
MCSFPALSGIIKLENSIQEKRPLVLATSKDHAIDGSLDRGSAVKGNNPPEPQGWIIFLAFYSRSAGIYSRWKKYLLPFEGRLLWFGRSLLSFKNVFG